MTPNQAGTKADQSAPSSSNVIVTNQSRVACNGVGGPLGHPQVWLTLGTDGKVTCPYCSCTFVAAKLLIAVLAKGAMVIEMPFVKIKATNI